MEELRSVNDELRELRALFSATLEGRRPLDPVAREALESGHATIILTSKRIEELLVAVAHRNPDFEAESAIPDETVDKLVTFGHSALAELRAMVHSIGNQAND